EFYAEMWETLQRDGCWDGEMIDRRRNGELYPKHVAISVVRNEQGDITNYVAAFSDITERKDAEEKIRFLAHHDSLTGLPNRALISDRFEQMRRRVSRQDGFIAVCFLDLDQFKRVNDTLGHRVGDALIVEVSRRLCGCLRQSDTVSRFGGDEFVLLLEGLTVPGQFAGIVEKIFTTFDAPVAIGSHLLPVSASIGVAVYPNDGEDFDTLLQKADTAMYHSKGRGRATFSFFDEKMNRDTASRLDIAMRLRGALQRDELRLAYQPQFALPDCRVVGVEALLRWHSDIYGDAAPDHFIPIAEETGQILAIGPWVLETACRQARRWAEAGSPLRMAVNVSSVQIYRDDFVAVLRQVLERTGVDPRLLEIEITESTVMADTDTIREVFSQVRQLGVAVAIDDFGTGYSSLAYLRRFHVGKLKVDRSFVRDLPGNEEARAIAEAIVRMGQSLHLVVIAEGVETSEQLDFLVSIGYDEVQGYLLGHPMPAAQLDGLLAARE
ncbi:MAG: EAL domain-containing protein, partial [Proteobacteria bacterium]|nr:EAL domain-containing protein [Pseudomonadota bacterium]